MTKLARRDDAISPGVPDDQPPARRGLARRDDRAPEERDAAARAWLAENAEALAGWNEWVEINGLPLAAYRQF